MHLETKWNSAQRERLAARMLDYYRSNEEYFEYVHDDSGSERPSQEEREMYQVIAASYEKAPEEVTQVLELGCGRARGIGALLELIGNCKYSGVEASIAAVKAAQAEHPEYDVQTGDITNLPFSAASFDIVTLNYVLEHLPAPYRVIDEILRVLRPRWVGWHDRAGRRPAVGTPPFASIQVQRHSLYGAVCGAPLGAAVEALI